MNVRTAVVSFALLVAFSPAATLAQASPIPLRTLTPNATSTEEFAAPVGFRELSDGRLVVLDISERRLVTLDANLGNAKPLSRTGSGPGEFTAPMFLIRGMGDTLLLGDMGNQRMLNIDPSGKMAGQKRVPEKPSIESMAIYTGTPVIDRLGRIVYQGPNVRASAEMKFTSDSMAPILRLNPTTGVIDTLARVRVSAPRMKMSGDPTNLKSMKMSMVMDPFPTLDDWALLPDGTLALIRGRDYHIDWIAPDGRITSTPPLSYIRMPLSDSLKKAYVTGLTKANEMMHERMSRLPSAMAAPVVAQTAPDTWPDYMPAIQIRNAIVSPDGNIWTFAKPVKNTKGPPYMYDVINRRGVVIEHVALPPKRTVAGFGRNSVYLAYFDEDQIAHIERASFK